MLVSVVMAAFNAERYVAESVESVLAQTHRDWELIVVDDGSTDSTQARVEGFDDQRIRVLTGDHVGVLAQVRNRGIEQARGDAIALLDTDDVWLPEKLERQVSVLSERPRVGLVHTAGARVVDGVTVEQPRLPAGNVFRGLLESNFVFSSSVVVRRELLEAHGAFDPDPALDGSPDYDLWLRLALRTEFAFVDDVLLLYRVHDAQMSSRERDMSLGALAALERARRRDGEAVRRERASYLLGIGTQRYRAGEPAAAFASIAASLALRPGRMRAWTWLLRAVLRLARVR